MTAVPFDPDPPMPEVLEGEDGEPLFFLGHLDPVHARVAVAIHLCREWGSTRDEAYGAAVLCNVDHEWLRDAKDPDDDERMDRCGPDDDGAMPFTVIGGLS